MKKSDNQKSIPGRYKLSDPSGHKNRRINIFNQDHSRRVLKGCTRTPPHTHSQNLNDWLRSWLYWRLDKFLPRLSRFLLLATYLHGVGLNTYGFFKSDTPLIQQATEIGRPIYKIEFCFISNILRHIFNSSLSFKAEAPHHRRPVHLEHKKRMLYPLMDQPHMDF